jgi:hypothetical protein
MPIPRRPRFDRFWGDKRGQNLCSAAPDCVEYDSNVSLQQSEAFSAHEIEKWGKVLDPDPLFLIP